VPIVEAARVIGERMLREGGRTVADRLAWAFRLVTGRPGTQLELGVLRELYTEQLALFTDSTAATDDFKPNSAPPSPTVTSPPPCAPPTPPSPKPSSTSTKL